MYYFAGLSQSRTSNSIKFIPSSKSKLIGILNNGDVFFMELIL